MGRTKFLLLATAASLLFFSCQREEEQQNREKTFLKIYAENLNTNRQHVQAIAEAVERAGKREDDVKLLNSLREVLQERGKVSLKNDSIASLVDYLHKMKTLRVDQKQDMSEWDEMHDRTLFYLEEFRSSGSQASEQLLLTNLVYLEQELIHGVARHLANCCPFSAPVNYFLDKEHYKAGDPIKLVVTVGNQGDVLLGDWKYEDLRVTIDGAPVTNFLLEQVRAALFLTIHADEAGRYEVTGRVTLSDSLVGNASSLNLAKLIIVE